MYLDKKKIGQFHVRISRAETGEIEELRARASVSMLGVRLYEFTQDLTQTWRAGELQKLQGMADDNGTKYDLQLAREAKNYTGKVNNKAVPDLAARGVSQLHLALRHRGSRLAVQ